jgi:hypothetical protein
MNSSNTLSVPGLEAVYDALAQAIDQAGESKSELFLVKLALLCARSIGDEQVFESLIQSALRDL